MTSYLQQLENNEAILLMYLAGELPDADCQEVEQMLASDSALQHELEILRQTQQLAFDALDSLDELTRPSQKPAKTQEQISGLMSDWLIRRREASEKDSRARAMPWRRIGFAAAAMLLVGYYIWAVYDRLDRRPPGTDSGLAQQDDGSGLETDLPYSRPPRPLSDKVKVALLSNSLEDSSADESELHVAEVAAAIPSDAAGAGDADSIRSGDSKAVGEP